MSDAPGTDLGGESPNGLHGTPPAVTEERLTGVLGDFRTEMINTLNGVLTGRLERFDLTGQVKSAIDALQQADPPKPATAKSAVPPEVEALQKQLQAQGDELTRERQSTAIRTALSGRGLTGTALEDAADALTRRKDITSELDASGRRIWTGTVTTEYGPQPKGLDDVVGAFLQDRPHYVPATHRGGSGAQGGGEGGPAAGQPKSIQDMTPEEVEGLSEGDFDAAWVRQGGASHGTQKGLYGDVQLPPRA